MLPSTSVTSRCLGIGFADLCGFTRLAQELDDEGLADLLDRFEDACADTIPRVGAGVVKWLGDGVLWSAPDATSATAAAVALLERVDDDPRLPPARAGVSEGRVLLRRGDAFGTPVNKASRLGATAPPGMVLVDRPAGDADHAGVVVLRDFGRVEVWSPPTGAPLVLCP